MKRFVRPALLAAGAVMLAACSVFGPSQQQAPAPQQSNYYGNDQHHDYPGPGTTTNRE